MNTNSNKNENLTFENLTSFEANFLSKFNEGYRTFDTLKENVSFNENTLKSIIESLTNKNIIKFDSIKKEYVYDKPLANEEKIILDGNIMLPVTIIRKPNEIIVTRGTWYKFLADFDVRRIIWNVQLNQESSNSTLINLIKESTLKIRKSRIVQVPEYKQLQNIIIPWNDDVLFQINTVGDEATDISLIFDLKLYLDKTKIDFVSFRGFHIRTEINTEELIEQLTCDVDKRDFTKIKVNRLYNFSDFIFSGNEIPYNISEKEIEYVKITGIKNKIELTFYTFDSNGKNSRTDVETYTDATEGLQRLKTLFEQCCNDILTSREFLVDNDSNDDEQ